MQLLHRAAGALIHAYEYTFKHANTAMGSNKQHKLSANYPLREALMKGPQEISKGDMI